MPGKILVVGLSILLAQSGFAQDQDKVEAFNAAWQTYAAAHESGDIHATVEAAREVLVAGKAALPEDDTRIPVLVQNYGSALLDAGKTDMAREQLEVALTMLEQEFGEDSVELISTLSLLADARGGVGNEYRQLQLYKRALRISAKHHGDKSAEYGDLAFRAARSIYDRSRSQAGKKYMDAAHEIFLAEYGEADWRVGLTNFYLGKMRFSRKQYKQAAEYLEAALPSFSGDSDNIKSLRLVTRALLVQTYESRGKSELATPHCVAIGSESQFSPNQDYKPIFRLAPRYPSEMLARGVEGFVDLSFTIDENGFVKDPVVIQSVPDKRRPGSSIKRRGSAEDESFEAAAAEVIKRFRYAPRFVDGEPVAVEGVKTRISFQLVD